MQGINETAAALLCKFRRLCQQHGMQLVIACIGPNDLHLLEAHGRDADFRVFGSIPDAIEYCEDSILAQWDGTTDGPSPSSL